MKLIFGNFIAGRAAIGLLIMRLVFGYGMMMHGLPKIQKPFSWMGDAPVPGILQFLAALSEFGGGIALILGLLTPLASFGMLCTMVVAILMVHLPQGHGFPGNDKGSYELAALYLTIALLTLASGPGKLSLDALIFDRSNTTKN